MPRKDKAARQAYQAEYGRSRPAERKAAGRRQQDKVREIIWQAKAKPCHDCGVQYPPWVMDLDHRDQEEKHPELVPAGTRTFWSLKLEDLPAEIAKCDVVCANCHRQRTYMKKQTSWRREAGTPEADVPELQLGLFGGKD